MVAFLPMSVSAATTKKEAVVTDTITEWILEEDTNSIYGISSNGKKLFIVDATTLQTKATVSFVGTPTGMVLEDGKLYVGLAGIKQIAIVDINNSKIEKTIYTSNNPYDLVKNGEELYYIGTNSSYVYYYNLKTEEEGKLYKSSFSSAAIELNKEDQILYIGTTNSSGSDLYYLDLKTKEIIKDTDYLKKRTFQYPQKFIAYDGEHIYYANREFSKENSEIFTGDYSTAGTSEKVMHVSGEFVFTNKSIFDKESHVRLGEFGSTVSLVAMSQKSLYTFTSSGNKITRYTTSESQITKKNIISLVSGKAQAAIPTTLSSEKLSEVSVGLSLTDKLTNWELSEQTGMLYALSSDRKAVFYINSDTLNLERSVVFKSTPSQLLVDGSTIYVSLEDTWEIIKLDGVTGAILTTIDTPEQPSHMVKSKDSLYYVTKTQHCEIYEYNFKTNTNEKLINKSYYYPALAVNEKENLLYIGESGSTGSKLYYVNLETKKEVSKTNYNNDYGFSSPSRNIIFDGSKVFYANRDFYETDATKFDGDYGMTGSFLHIGEKFVITKDAIYDKESHIKQGSLKTELSLANTTKTAVFTYIAKENIIKKYQDGNKELANNTIVSLLSAEKTEQIPETMQGEIVGAGVAGLRMKYSLTDWQLEEESHKLYAISAEANALFILDADTLDLERRIIFKSAPGDLIVEKDKVYVSLPDAHQIQVVNGNTGEIEKTLYTISDPSVMVKDNHFIYYAEGDQHCYIYKYNLATDKDQYLLPLTRFYEPDLAINKEAGILYIAITGKLTYCDTETGEILATGSNARSNVVYDGTYVYTSNYAIDPINPERIYGQFGPDKNAESIVFAKYGYVYTKNYIYDIETFEEVDTTGGMNLVELDENGREYYYDAVDGYIYQVDLENAVFVFYETYTDDTFLFDIVNRGTLLKQPENPTRAGYTFAGWYKDEKFQQPWDFELDVVEEDLVLYANWIQNPAQVTELNVRGSYDYITLTWNKVSNASEYEIYRATSKNGKYTLLATTAATTVIDTKAAGGTTYYYKVCAVKEQNGIYAKGNYSEIETGKLTLSVPTAFQIKAEKLRSTQLVWAEVEGATHYEVYRSSSYAGSYAFIGKSLQGAYVDNNLEPDTYYYYKVRAYRESETMNVRGAFSEIREVKTKFEGVTTVKVSGTSYDRVMLGWENLDGATTYQVFRSTSKDSGYTIVASVSASTYIDMKVVPNKAYYYKVRPVKEMDNKKEYGSYSATVSAKPVLKSIATSKVTGTTYNTVTLNWSAVSGATGYQIYYSESKSGPYILAGASNKTSFTHTNRTTGKTYYYKVRAYRTVGKEHGYSGFGTVISGKTILSIPTKFTAKRASSTSIQVTWSGVKGATGYQVYRVTSKGGKYTLAKTVKGTSLKQTGLKKGKTYYYKVRAYKTVGTKKVYSAFTAVKSARP